MSRSHLIKLIYRSALLVGALVYYVVCLATKKAEYGAENDALFLGFGDGVPVFLIIMTVVFVPEMIFRFFPNKHEAMGNQKIFKLNYIPNSKKVKPRKQHPLRTLLVIFSWVALNLVIGGLNHAGIIADDVMVIICLAYSVCDLICIMFFCPFQAWMMKNKCCATCRIYNWDYVMMFTPFFFLLFKPAPILHYVMLGMALAVLIFWEISYLIHPERFTENTNQRLSCKDCTEKLCKHNKLFPSKAALSKLAEDKKAQTKID